MILRCGPAERRGGGEREGQVAAADQPQLVQGAGVADAAGDDDGDAVAFFEGEDAVADQEPLATTPVLAKADRVRTTAIFCA